ncbi:transmembrane protein 140-like [Acridotheres tristis]
MSYALGYEAGNLVNLPDKRIGFYNFCLWNDTAAELQCLDNKQLQAMGISLLEIALARVCVYSCLVVILFHFTYILFMNYTGERMECKIICNIPLIKMIMLSAGLFILIFKTRWWICLSDFTGGFLALLGTLALLQLEILMPLSTSADPSPHKDVKVM